MRRKITLPGMSYTFFCNSPRSNYIPGDPGEKGIVKSDIQGLSKLDLSRESPQDLHSLHLK
jgi:hypothetical protein